MNFLRIVLVFITLSLTYLSAYAQDYDWVKFYTGNYLQQPVCMSVDKSGNQYAAFNSSVGQIILDSQLINTKALLIKQDSSGKTLWYQSLSAPQNMFVYILSTNFTSSGNLLSLVSARTDIIIGTDTLFGINGNNTNTNIFALEFNTSGQLVKSRCILHAYFSTLDFSGNGTHNKIEVDNQNNIYASFSHRDTVIVSDSNGLQTLIPGLGTIQSIFKFSALGEQFNWRTSMPAPSRLTINDLDVDQHGLIYLAGRHIYNPVDSSILKLSGFSISNLPSSQVLGMLYVLGNDGIGKNWIRFRNNNNLCALHNVVAHDSNSVFISGMSRGDSLHTPSTSIAFPVFSTYHFYGLYSIKGQEHWVKHEDTSVSGNFSFNNQFGSVSHFEDEFYYVSFYNPHNSSIAVSYGGQKYSFPSNWLYANGVTLKIDFRGDVLWCLRSEHYPFISMGTDQISNLYFQGSWSSDTLYFGSITSPRANSVDAFIGKTFDYGIFRGDVSEGPYCAGDTLLVPYTLQGSYGDSNVFIAELSDEQGNFIGDERELGRLISKVSDTIRGTLPLLQVASSQNYRIRVRSTQPQVQSFFRLDTLRLLVYSKDKADPGAADTLCFGDTLQLNTYGGTKWTWSPAYNMSDSSVRQPLVWPDSNRIYQIIIGDSSGCGQADTAYKHILVRAPLQLTAPFSDTLVCPLDSIQLRLTAAGGKPDQYLVSWYKIVSNTSEQLSTHQLLNNQDSFSVSGLSGDTSGTVYLAVLSDSCSEIFDSVTFLVKSYLAPKVQLPISDTTICLKTTFQVGAMASGGRPSSYHYNWEYNSLPFGTQTMQISLDSAPKINGILKVYLRDACNSSSDSAQLYLSYFNPINADIGHNTRPLRDTSLCPGSRLLLTNQYADTGSGLVQYFWIWGRDTISNQAQIYFDADSIRLAYPVPADSLLISSLKLVVYNACETIIDSVLIRVFDYPVSPIENSAVTVIDSVNLVIHFDVREHTNISEFKIYRQDGNSLYLLNSLPYQVGNYSLNDTFNLTGNWPCYIIETIDSCSNVSQIPSICIQRLNGVAEQLQNTLTWKLDSVYRAQSIWLWNGASWDSLSSLNFNDSVFMHEHLLCDTEYRYRLGFLTSNNQQYFSNPISLFPSDTIAPQSPSILHAGINETQHIILHWNKSVDVDVNNYEVWRDTGTGMQLIQVLKDTHFIDLYPSPDSIPPSYSIIAIDRCGNGNRSTFSDTIKHFRISLETGDCKSFVKIAWENYPNSLAVEQFIVYRSLNGQTFTAIDSGQFNSGVYFDSTVLDANWYAYKIEAQFSQKTYQISSDTDAIKVFVYPVSAMAKMDRVTVTSSGPTGAIDLYWMKWDMSDTFARGYYIWYLNGNNTSLISTETDLNNTYFQHQPINVNTSTHAYAISTYNLCHDDSSGLFHQSEFSTPHQSILLLGQAKNLSFDLIWTAYQGFQVDEYELWRSENNGSSYYYATVLAGDTSYTDTLLSCGRDYKYQILAKEKMGSHSSWSNQIELQAFDTIAPAINKIKNASVLNTNENLGILEIEIEGTEERNANKIYIYRVLPSGMELLLDSLPNLISASQTIQFSNLNTINESFSYKIKYSDSCGNISAFSDSFSLIYLKVEAINNAMQLNWSSLHGYNTLEYLVQRQDGMGNWLTIASLNSATQSFIDTNIHCSDIYNYRIVANELSSNLISLSNSSFDTAFSSDLPEAVQLNFISVTETALQGKIQAEWTSDTTNIASYQLEISTDSLNWMPVYSGLNLSHEAINLATTNQAFYFRARAEDSCGNHSATYSSIHRSIYLQSIAGNEEVNLSWTPYQGQTVLEYKVFRDAQLIATLPATATQYLDTGLVCLHNYIFEIEAVLDFNYYSKSNLSIAKPLDIKSPETPTLQLVSVSKANERIELSWKPIYNFDLAGFELAPYPSASSEFQIPNPQQQRIELPWSTSQNSCYQIRSYDSCENRSPYSAPVCIILLKAKVESTQNRIDWNHYNYFQNGLAYYEIYVSNDTVTWTQLAILAPGTTNFTHINPDSSQSSFVYQIRAYSNDLNPLVSYSSVDAVVQSPVIWVPNAFTPRQSSGLNDVFKPEGAWLSNYTIQIWNRWGQIIYEGENHGWDGTYLGTPVQEGLYVYSITITGLDGSRHLKKGTLNVY